jgi:ubiquinol-cytochrome c reductase cytochrome c subunit
MRASLLVAAAWLFGSMLVLGQQRHVADHDSRWTSPPDQAAKTNPLTNRAETVAGGKKLFQQRCATCHGQDASGTAKAPNLTGSTVQRQSDGALFWKITSGNTRSGMPTFSFLPPLQRWQLVLYLRSGSSAPTNGTR